MDFNPLVFILPALDKVFLKHQTTIHAYKLSSDQTQNKNKYKCEGSTRS